MFRKKHWEIHNSYSSNRRLQKKFPKEVTRIDKNKEEVTKNISYISQFIDYWLSWQAHYEVLSIIFMKEFIKLNLNTDTIIKNIKLGELHTKYGTVFATYEF